MTTTPNEQMKLLPPEGTEGFPSAYAPTGTEFGLQLADNITKEVAEAKACKVLRRPAYSLEFRPGHFGGHSRWAYKKHGWMVFKKLGLPEPFTQDTESLQAFNQTREQP